MIFLFALATIANANAQKGNANTATINPISKLARNLPDLNILLIPRLTNGGDDAIYQPVAGIAGRVKIPVDIIIKNIGFASSKPCKVVLYAHYQRNRTFSEVEHGVAEGAFNDAAISEPMPLLALEQGKDVVRSQAFIFSRFPTLAPGKKVRLTAVISYPTGSAELEISNNTSRTFEVNLVTIL